MQLEFKTICHTIIAFIVLCQVSRAGQGHQAQQGRHPARLRHLRQDPEVGPAQEAAAGGDLQAAARAAGGRHGENQGEIHIIISKFATFWCQI